MTPTVVSDYSYGEERLKNSPLTNFFKNFKRPSLDSLNEEEEENTKHHEAFSSSGKDKSI